MKTFLSRCAAVGLIAGGFAITGDLSRLMARGTHLLNATAIPQESPTAPVEGVPSPANTHPPGQMPAMTAAADQSAAAVPLPAAVPSAAPQPAATADPFDAPVGRRVSHPAPPADGLERIDSSSLQLGDRLLVWIGGRGGRHAVIAFDLIDPASGEAIEHRHVFTDMDDDGVQIAGRRVRFAGATNPRQIAVADQILLLPIGIVHGAPAAESLGPVTAIQLQR
jgi:hypothetical protein